MSTFQDPFAGLVRGILQGAQVRAQLQRTQDEHDAMQRQALQQARENRIQDITQRMALEGSSRPVQNGTVTETGEPTSVNLGGVSIPLPGMNLVRPADKSRTVKYKDQDGNEFQRELMTPEEQFQKQLTQKTALARAGNIPINVPDTLQSMLGSNPLSVPPAQAPSMLNDIMNAVHKNTMYDVPPEDQDTYSLPAKLPGDLYDNYLGFKRGLVTNQNTQEQENARNKNSVDAANTRSAAEIAAADRRAAAANATRLRAADPFGVVSGGAPAAVPGAQGGPTAPQQAPLPRGIGQAPTTAVKAIFLKAAGGDPAKAKQMLQANKWRVQ
jgi:hypothetical protein